MNTLTPALSQGGEGAPSTINSLMLKLNLTILTCLALCTTAIAEVPGFKGGHAKYRFLMNTLPGDSLFQDFVDSPMIDHNGDLRLLFDWRKDKTSVVADYQLIAQHGDSFTLAKNLPGSVIISDLVADDEHRLFDLTHVLSEDNNSALVHRLDRLYAEYTTNDAVARFGRQAISWGNGLIYTPMDFINPFDPSSIDKEYKTGDDMLYGQYLQQSGNDLQAVWVLRRDSNGNVSNDVDSLAAKYHGFIGNNEYDLLLAEHYDDNIFAIGGIVNIGGAVWRGDVTLTRTNNTLAKSDNIFSLVTSLSYSWSSWGHNVSGIAEYFYNGFGQTDGNYDPAALASNPELVKRFLRGELFTLGRHYIAVSAMIEITPLWLLTPNIFLNASDGSLLTQLVTTYDLKQDWQLLAALSIPVGASGTEYGGIDSDIAGKQLSTDLNVFAQLAWYF
ncbi:MAG: hypothetical protein KAT61_01835 [Gammaproteobacteria bacterium]|nr:hypothetical protein [Gammaproteobacteria bacterium]